MKSTTRQTIRFYLEHVKKQKWLAVLVFLGIFIGVSIDMVYPLIIKEMIDLMTEGVGAVEISKILFYLIPLTIAYLIGSGGWRLAIYSIVVFEPRVMESISKECFASVHKHSYNFFNNEFVGSLVKRVNRMVRSFESFFDVIAFEMFTIVIRLSLGIAVLFWLNAIFGIAMVVWAAVFISFNYFISLYKLKKYDVPKTKAESEATGYLADTISNNINIKLFSNRAHENRGFGRVLRVWKRRSISAWRFNAHAELIQNLTMIVLEIFMLYMSIKLWGEGSLSLGSFVLVQTYLMEIFMSTWHFGRYIRRLYEAFADAEEMTEILNTPIGIKDVKNAKDLVIRRGKVEFKNVDFSYGDLEGAEDSESVICGLNLTIRPGEKVALIGPSGGGKSTIVRLLLRLFDINKGKISVDGQEIAKVTQDSVRAQIALVPQDPILFHRSLMENIRYGRLDASDEEVLAASKMAHCHEFIEGFSKGYETLVGERGVKLSGGEKQRVAIARAILSNAKILILDEATSSLDVHSEQLIQEALVHLTKNKTTIVIAHRLSTVTNVDRIIVLENGEIVEEGGHSELMNNEDGLYKSLWDVSMQRGV